MLIEFIIGFRESLEISLIIGLITSYFLKTGQKEYLKHIVAGLVLGLLGSFLGAVAFVAFFGGFQGVAEQIFEGVLMFFGAFLLTTFIIWLMRQEKSFINIKRVVSGGVTGWGTFLIVFLSVIREGVETVVFMYTAALFSGNFVLLSAVSGMFIAVVLTYLFFRGFSFVKMKVFFSVTNILLLLFSAGLVSGGVHEFQEAGIFPTFTEHVWNTNGIIDETGTFGSLLKGLFGYNGDPSALEVLSYVLYLFAILFIMRIKLFNPHPNKH